MSAERHPVADLLNDEQRERVRAKRFTQTPLGLLSDGLCPIAVAFGLEAQPSAMKVCEVGGWAFRSAEHDVVNDFIYRADSGYINPADVYVMLGVEPPAGEVAP